MLRHVADLWPRAPVYTALHDPAATGDLVDPARVRVSPLQRVPGAGRWFRYFAPVYPAIFERFDLSAYDLVVSTTTAWSKGVRFGPGAVHVSYVHTVSRFAFAYDDYVAGLAGGGARGLAIRAARPVVSALAAWDRRAALRPTRLLANSANVAARIGAHYARDAAVVHCPVDLERFAVGEGGGDYMLAVSRLLPYKRIDIAIAAAKLAGLRLLVVGSGPARPALEAMAAGSRVELLGHVPDTDLRALMGRARAIVLPGEEDYGLVPLEAAASGRPTIAYGRGGALETVVAGVTGAFFAEPSPASLAAAMAAFDERAYDPAAMRAHAERFSPERFGLRFRALVDEAVAAGPGRFDERSAPSGPAVAAGAG